MMRYSLIALFVVIVACNRGPEPPPVTEPAAADKAAAEKTAAAPAPTSQPAAAAPTSQPAAAGDMPPPAAGGLTWEAQAPLMRRKPKSSMRKAEYGIEASATAEMTVFYFGPGQGGDVESNITRWVGQIKQADGSDSASRAKRASREVSGIKVHTVEVGGVYANSMPMGGGGQPVPGSLLLGAIAEGPQGPVFFKLTGLESELRPAQKAFEAMLDSLKPVAP